MTSKIFGYTAGVVMVLVAVASFVFLGGQYALADEADGGQISNDVFEQLCENGLPPLFNCEDDASEEPQNPPVDPCTDIFPQIPGLQCEGDSEEDPVDVCPDMDGIQTSTSECPGNGGGGGGGGGTLPACSDTLDNDNDGQTDLNDSDCSDAQDNDESAPSTGGGGGGGGGGSGGGYLTSTATTATSTGEVLAATTTAQLPDVACDAFLTAFIKPGGDNDAEQVTRLQSVLKMFEGHELETNGVYDDSTINAVHDFQAKYAGDILTPWGISQSTGFVYLTTRKKVNEVYCENKVAFPLSEEEQKLIEGVEYAPVSGQVSAAAEAVIPKITYQESVEEPQQEVQEEVQEETSDEESAVGGPWSRISDFFKRILNRAR
jgi:hypothetical protein